MIGILVGLAAEARLARGLGGLIEASGGTEIGAEAAVQRLRAAGVTAVLSFGLAGGLDPALRPGAVLVPRTILAGKRRYEADSALCAWLGGDTGHTLLGGGDIVATAAAKAGLNRATGAAAVDLESGAAARSGLPFAALRAICDPAERDLPHAALTALDARGRIGGLRVAAATLAHPRQIPALIRLGGDAARARQALLARVALIV